MGISYLHLIKMFSLLLISLTISTTAARPWQATWQRTTAPLWENMHRIALRTWPDTTLTWSTLSLTGSSPESRAPSICASPWAPAGLSRSSPVRSASKEWSGLRLTWKTPSSRLRLNRKLLVDLTVNELFAFKSFPRKVLSDKSFIGIGGNIEFSPVVGDIVDFPVFGELES